MAYARLDVFWPDGRFDSFLLETDTVSVGRAPGNTIALDTDTISRYHFSITRDDEKIGLTDLDSANGTFVDGKRIESNKPHQLDGVEEIQIGNLRMIFQTVDDSPTMPVAVTEEDTQESRVETEEFEVGLDKLKLSVWPASSNSVEVSITNYTSEAHIYALSVGGLPKEWVRMNHPRLEIGPGDTAYILVNVRPVRRADTAPGSYAVTLTVTPQDKTLNAKTVPITVNIEPYSGFGVALTTPELETGEEFQMYLHNQGTLPLEIDLTGESPKAPLSFNLPPSPVQLVAGKRVQIRGTISATQRPIIGSESHQPFRLKAKSRNASGFVTVVEGKVTVTPMMPTWAAISAAGIAVSAIIILLVIMGGVLFPPPEPQIANFTVNSTQIAKGSPIILQWEALDADSYTLLVNGTAIPDVLGSSRASYEIGTNDLSGDVSIELRAINGENSDAANQTVNIYQPVRLGSFTVQPTQLTRHFVSSLTLSWNVPGAVFVRIDGMESFSNAPMQASYDAQLALEPISGIAAHPFTLTLYAEDEAGNSIQETVDIVVIEPACTVTEDTALREGPDFSHQVISQIDDDETLFVVNAQDETGNWLRTTVAGEVLAWAPRDAFQCDATLNLAELQKAIDVPPVPTATLIPSPTALPTQTRSLVSPTPETTAEAIASPSPRP